MSKNLNSKSRTALIWDLSGSFVRQFAALFITTILARLLGPEEYGLIGMALVFIHVSAVFTDAGFTSGLIQQKDTKDITLSSIFYLNLGISLVLSIIIILTSTLIADFYEEPRIKDILIFLAIIPPITAVGKVHDAILTKKLDFKSLTIRSLIATVIGGVLGVIAAFSDFGVYSLVIQQIAMAITATTMLWYSTKWRPKWEYSSKEVKSLFSFSSYVFFDSLLRQIANKIDTLFIGKVFSPVVLGFYSRAETLKTQVQTYTTSSLSKVIFPMLSLIQDDDEKFKETYLKVFALVSGLIVFLIAPLYFTSHYIVLFLFGKEWKPTAVLFQILILTAIFSPQINIMGRAILAKGYSKLKFKTGLLQRFFKLLPIAVGLFYGIQEFAYAMVVSVLLVFIMLSYILKNKLKIRFWTQIKSFIIPNVVFVALIIIHYLTEKMISEWIFVLLFLVLQSLYIYIIKHDSYIFLKSNYGKILKRIKKKMIKINFIGIGAQKSGTTWLFEQFEGSNQIELPPKKEIHYFDRSPDYLSPNFLAESQLTRRILRPKWLMKSIINTILNINNFNWYWNWFFSNYNDDWYLSLFKNLKKCKGEITPAYAILNEEDVKEMSRLLGSETKIIFMLRNPVDRAWSSYKYYNQKHNSKDINISALEFLKSEYQIKRSQYSKSINLYRKYFKSVFIGFFDAIIENPRELLRNLFIYLELDDSEVEHFKRLNNRVNKSIDLDLPSDIKNMLEELYRDELKMLSSKYGGYFLKWENPEEYKIKNFKASFII